MTKELQHNCPDCKHIGELSHRGPCRHCKPGEFRGTHFSPAYDEPEEETEDMDETNQEAEK